MKKLFTGIFVCLFIVNSSAQSSYTRIAHRQKKTSITIHPAADRDSLAVKVNALDATEYKIYSPDGKMQSRGKIIDAHFNIAIKDLTAGTYTIITNKKQSAQFVIL